MVSWLSLCPGRRRRGSAGGSTHRPLSSSVLGLPYRILNINHKKELLRGVWVVVLVVVAVVLVIVGLVLKLLYHCLGIEAGSRVFGLRVWGFTDLRGCRFWGFIV